MANPGDEELANLIADVVAASKIPAKRRGTSIKPTVDKLASQAYSDGITATSLDNLASLVTRPSCLDQASLNALVRNLYPAARVSRAVILKVVGCLGLGELKPSLALQAALLRWLVLVYHVIEDPSVLSRSYAVLFNLLDTAALRPQLCHILALITRRKHVRPFRIQAILNLSRQTGSDPALTGLLRVYKDYYPEIIVGEAVRGKASAFKHPDPQWRERLDTIQEARLRQDDGAAERPSHAFRVNRQGPGARRGPSRAIPGVHTSHVAEDAVTLEEIDSVDAFTRNLERIELPNQLAAVLADPLLRKLLLLRPSEESSRRIANWVAAAAQDIVSGDADAAFIGDVLSVLQEYAAQTKHLPPVVLGFLAQFFRSWNGSEQREVVLEIVAYCPFLEFDGLYLHILQPLEVCVLDNTPESQLQVLRLYARLLGQWLVLLRSLDSLPNHASDTVAKLVGHTNKLALTVLQTSPTVSTHSALTDFYEHTSTIISDPVLKQHLRIVLLPAQVVYTLFFSHCAAITARICYLIACYRRGFELSSGPSSRARGTKAPTYPADYITRFNHFVLDICNCLWRFHAFEKGPPKTLGCLLPERVVPQLRDYVERFDTDIPFSSMFALSYSPTLCLQSILYLRELEDEALEDGEDAIAARHAGPVTQNSLKRNEAAGGIELNFQDYRVGVLEALDKNGLGGIPDLLRSSVKTLQTSGGR